MFEILSEPFAIRALYGGIVVSILCALLGVFISLRQQSFLTDGIAHASLAGIALGLLLGFEPLYIAILLAVIMAIAITYLKQKSIISFDATIGIFYAIFFSAGILIIHSFTSFKPDLFTYLFGSVLTITWEEIAIAFVILLIASVILHFLYKKIMYMTFDPDGAYIRGVNTRVLDYMLNILSSVAVIIAVKLVGVVLVTALMIIPATAGKFIVKRFNQMIPFAILYSIILTSIGILTSFFLNAPSGATIVIVQGLGLGLILFSKKVFLK